MGCYTINRPYQRMYGRARKKKHLMVLLFIILKAIVTFVTPIKTSNTCDSQIMEMREKRRGGGDAKSTELTVIKII